MKIYARSVRTSTRKHSMFKCQVHTLFSYTRVSIQPADKAVEHPINSYDYQWRRNKQSMLFLFINNNKAKEKKKEKKKKS